jgi:ATP-binding cassette subfamily F protein uup
VFAFEPGGTLRQFPGNYSVYLDCKKDEEAGVKEAGAKSQDTGIKPQSVGSAPPLAVIAPAAKTARKLSYKEKREYETLETQIPQLETEKADLEKLLDSTSPGEAGDVQQLAQQLAEVSQAIDAATGRWLELAERGN